MRRKTGEGEGKNASGNLCQVFVPAIIMKSTKVQTLGAVALHATTACTEGARLKYCWLRSTSLGCSQEVVIHLVVHVSGYIRAFKLPTCNGRLRRGRYVYEKLQRDKMADVCHGRQETL